MSTPLDELPRRHRSSGGVLIIAVGGVAAVLGAAMAAALVIVVLQVSDVADQAKRAADQSRRALVGIADSRRQAAQTSCENLEALKDGLRFILRGFDVNAGRLPVDPSTGRRPLARIPGGCVAYSRRVTAIEP